MKKPYIIHMAGMILERIKIAKKYILDNISYFDFSESKIENIKKLNSIKNKKKMISSFKLLLEELKDVEEKLKISFNPFSNLLSIYGISIILFLKS